MQCRLCGLEKELRNSHIISEAFYKGLYDTKHRAFPIQLENNEFELIQKGIREKLLCGDCEVKISKWEDTLKRDLNDICNLKSNFLIIERIHNNFIKVDGIRYDHFKLGVLSILWRMSITTNDYFKSYCLGPYEEKIRNILFKEEVPPENRYAVCVSRYELNDIFYPELILGFPSSRFDSHFVVQQFIIMGHCFTIFVNDRYTPPINREIFLRDSGSLLINIRSLLELSGKDSVMEKLFNSDIDGIFKNKMKW